MNSFIPAVIFLSLYNCKNCQEMLYIFLSQHSKMQELQKIPAEVNRLAQQTEITLSEFLPFSSKSERLTRPKTAQNKDWVVSKRLQKRLQMRQAPCRDFSWLNSHSFFSKENLTLRYAITLKNSNIFYKNIKIFAHQPKYPSS